MGASRTKTRKHWVIVEGGPMDGVMFTAMLVGEMPFKLYGPDLNPRMAGVYIRVSGGEKLSTYRLRNDAQHQARERKWTDYLMQRLTREELDDESG